jgi:excinuclease ABC subunit C
MDASEHIKGILDTLPIKPGCYIMKNATGEIIYVGKAVNLHSRVRSYFKDSRGLDPKTRQLVRHITTIEWILVGSELEALILEMNLIKKHRPHYNIRLKDDKRYPYIKVHWKEPFPKVTVTRQMVDDGSRYFGPYTSVWAVHQTLDVIRRIFPYLTCDREITGNDPRACLYYDIKLCGGPCIGAIQQVVYRQMINDLCLFLQGRTDPVVSRMKVEMEQAAEGLNFERAAAIRDQIHAIDQVVEKQKVISSERVDSDVIAVARSDGEACVQIFFIRSGKLIGREYFVLEGTEDANESEVLGGFIKQFYSEAATIPAQVLLPNDIEETQIIEQWLRSRRSGEKVEILVPHSGVSQELVQMAAENATETLNALRKQWQADTNRQTEALAELQQALNLPTPPNRIECYDISNTQGTASVASMVVFEQGVPNKKKYRHFNIATVSGPDDFASMEEVLTRRFRRWQTYQEAQSPGHKPDPSFSSLPDLLIVDGGKGQLSRAVAVLERFGLFNKVPVIGLAKHQEELFTPHKSDSLLLPRHSQGLYLIQRIRDEAHRFAITAHRGRRSRQGLVSRLDKIRGIGPSRRRALLTHFSSIEDIIQAPIEELIAIKGITPEIAQTLKTQLE